MTGYLNASPQPVHDPHAVLNSPGLSLVFLTKAGFYLSFTEPADAIELAAACTRAAELLSGPQLVGET